MASLQLTPCVGIPRPNNALPVCLQLSQLQVEVKQVGQHVNPGPSAVGLEHHGIGQRIGLPRLDRDFMSGSDLQPGGNRAVGSGIG